MRYAVIASPIGDLVAWGETEALAGLGFADSPRSVRVDPAWSRDDSGFPEVAEQLEAYFGGRLTAFDLRLQVRGTTFQQRVWEMVRTIPYGTTVTYGELAAELGKPRAMRAVGSANGSNPISIIIPCHRLVGVDGSLTGYGGGLERKRWLLGHEGAHPWCLWAPHDIAVSAVACTPPPALAFIRV
ncbi:MAG: methylated-DNA--[protein]-cysteine S-methyltransferase [Chloroflexi bacterium]|nr:methylated-DNA--[protein]-cysteine S-methyltransferase [Chloroflexota bacterium]